MTREGVTLRNPCSFANNYFAKSTDGTLACPRIRAKVPKVGEVFDCGFSVTLSALMAFGCWRIVRVLRRPW